MALSVSELVPVVSGTVEGSSGFILEVAQVIPSVKMCVCVQVCTVCECTYVCGYTAHTYGCVALCVHVCDVYGYTLCAYM